MGGRRRESGHLATPPFSSHLYHLLPRVWFTFVHHPASSPAPAFRRPPDVRLTTLMFPNSTDMFINDIIFILIAGPPSQGQSYHLVVWQEALLSSSSLPRWLLGTKWAHAVRGFI